MAEGLGGLSMGVPDGGSVGRFWGTSVALSGR